ncbi:coproporphyrinogen III oxidase [Chryseobacterium sp. Leaf180]|nr:coproporphyrinogen III oxidase [Chryseobacterium sp. Leaf180]
MVSAIKKEIFLRKDFLQNRDIKSLYFGGGTPSILSTDDLNSIIDEVLKYFSFSSDIEITLEANPDDLDKNFLSGLSKTAVNRLSIGTQSFFNEDLRLMNRAHNASEAEDSIKRSQDFGFSNISIDLIYGSPTSNLEIWKQNLAKTLALEIPHISAYALTVEPKTALESWISSGKVVGPIEEVQHDEFIFMTDFLSENGYEHYEISNFGKPGMHSRHNSAYWEGKEYLGIGPSAHSFNGSDRRSWNVAHNKKYIDQIAASNLPEEHEILTEKEHFNEMLMIGLRTKKGVSMDRLKTDFSADIFEKLIMNIKSKIYSESLVIENNYLKIPEEKWFSADGIASDLFMV